MNATRDAAARARSAYLQALGIQEWVSRLPQLAPALEPTPAPGPAPAPATRSAPTSPAPEDASWAALRTEVAGCQRCGLAATRTQTVFGVGNIRAPWLIIGEAPGAATTYFLNFHTTGTPTATCSATLTATWSNSASP